MKFTCKNARDRYVEMRSFAMENHMLDNFNEVFARLLTWEHFSDDGCEQLSEIYIGLDFDARSFTFAEHRSNGDIGICGGIIFHGTPKGGYQENGSVQLSLCYGWQIHT